MHEIKGCQINCVGQIGRPNGVADVLWQQRNRVRRILKRRWRYVVNLLAEVASKPGVAGDRVGRKSAVQALRPGDLVRVRPEQEIRSTLNHWNQLKSCSFMQEMWPYCGTNQKVFKRVEKFLDERDYLMKQCKGIVILENVFCQGTKDFGACDRTCFFFWREEWLEKIE